MADPGGGEALLTVFDRICVINLAERTDRRAEMARALARIGLGFDHPRVSLVAAERPADPGPFPGIGVRGCFLSHLGVLRAAARDGLGAVLVLEDDLDFPADIAARLPPLAAALGRLDWALFYGGWAEPPGTEPLPGAPGLVAADPARAILLAHCVGFRGPAIAEAADYLAAMLGRPLGDPEGGPMHVDGAYSWYRRAHPHRLTVAAVPAIGFQRPSRSDIAPRAWFDRIGALAPLVRAARRVKGALLGR
jgi:glycosyl transferase, family 25